MEIARHFTATTVIVYRGRALLHRHKKLNMWLPVGGHIDCDELPHEAALREVKEETGLTVTLHNPDPSVDFGDVCQLIRPMHILLENVFEHTDRYHQHIDLIYYATSDTDDIKPNDGETDTMKWFTAEEIMSFDAAPRGVKMLALEAIDVLTRF